MRTKASFFAVLTMIIILLGVYVVDRIEREQQKGKLRAEVLGQLRTVEAKLEGGMHSRLFLEKGLIAFVMTHLAIDPQHQITQEEVDKFCREFMPQLLGIRNITLIQNGIISHVYPLDGNEKAIGVDLSRIPAQKEQLRKVAENRKSMLVGPVDLVQGGVGIINRTPIYWTPQGGTEAVYWGQSSLVLMQDTLFEEAGIYDQSGLRFALRGRNGLGAAGDLFWGEDTVFQSDPVVIDVKLPDGYWQLAAVPVGGWDQNSPLFYWIWIVGGFLACSSGALVWFLLNLRSEITERKQAEERLKYLSFHDTLTGLYARSYFEHEMQRLDQAHHGSVGLIICDLDGLKLVNDTLGHEYGDQMLINTADILKKCFYRSDVVARIGGDEFAVVLEEVTQSLIEEACTRVRHNISVYNEDNQGIPMSLSIGYALCTGASVSIRELYKEADDNMYREKLHRRQSTRSAMVQTVMRLLEARDFITEGHADRLQEIVSGFGKAVGLTEGKIADLRLLAQFHDIGKVGIPDRILLKPASLTQEEMIEMRRHCEIGHRIALSSPDLAPIADWILKHHEWWNGGGYPLGLTGEHIPLACRILAIVDAYDAITNDRPYRKALGHQAAIAELKRCAGTQFDPQLVAVFAELMC